jgi:hypothetical protein
VTAFVKDLKAYRLSTVQADIHARGVDQWKSVMTSCAAGSTFATPKGASGSFPTTLGRPVEREPETAEEAHALMRERMRNAWRTAR